MSQEPSLPGQKSLESTSLEDSEMKTSPISSETKVSLETKVSSETKGSLETKDETKLDVWYRMHAPREVKKQGRIDRLPTYQETGSNVADNAQIQEMGFLTMLNLISDEKDRRDFLLWAKAEALKQERGEKTEKIIKKEKLALDKDLQQRNLQNRKTGKHQKVKVERHVKTATTRLSIPRRSIAHDKSHRVEKR